MFRALVLLTAMVLPGWAVAGDDAPRAPAEKRYTVEFRDLSWARVFEWLSEQTNLPVITQYKVPGTFSFTAGKQKSFTLPEILDLLNEALVLQKYRLVRKPTAFVLVPADERVNPDLVPRVEVKDLSARGQTEMVAVVVPLKGVRAEEIAGDIKKLLGPFGDVVALRSSNQLLLHDTTTNLLRAARFIVDAEAAAKATPPSPPTDAVGQKWEYKVVAFPISRSDPEELTQQINKLAAAGWELVAPLGQVSGNYGANMTSYVTFKRVKK